MFFNEPHAFPVHVLPVELFSCLCLDGVMRIFVNNCRVANSREHSELYNTYNRSPLCCSYLRHRTCCKQQPSKILNLVCAYEYIDSSLQRREVKRHPSVAIFHLMRDKLASVGPSTSRHASTSPRRRSLSPAPLPPPPFLLGLAAPPPAAKGMYVSRLDAAWEVRYGVWKAPYCLSQVSRRSLFSHGYINVFWRRMSPENKTETDTDMGTV